MTTNDMMNEIATGLRDAIRETPFDDLKGDPENTYTDLAARLMLRLLAKQLTVVPTNRELMERVRIQHAEAAQRIFIILTEWMTDNPDSFFVTGIGADGRFEITLKDHDETQAYFQGVSVQDAYAQAAQAVSFIGDVS